MIERIDRGFRLDPLAHIERSLQHSEQRLSVEHPHGTTRRGSQSFVDPIGVRPAFNRLIGRQGQTPGGTIRGHIRRHDGCFAKYGLNRLHGSRKRREQRR